MPTLKCMAVAARDTTGVMKKMEIERRGEPGYVLPFVTWWARVNLSAVLIWHYSCRDERHQDLHQVLRHLPLCKCYIQTRFEKPLQGSVEPSLRC
jgi:hypothetical protein